MGDRTWIVLAHCISHLSSNQSFLCDNAIFSLARLAQGEYQITAIFKYDASCSRQIPQIRSSFTPEHLCVVPLPPHGGTSHLRLKVDAGRSPFVDSPSGSSLTPLAFGSPVRLIFDGSSSPPREHRCVLPTVGCESSGRADGSMCFMFSGGLYRWCTYSLGIPWGRSVLNHEWRRLIGTLQFVFPSSTTCYVPHISRRPRVLISHRRRLVYQLRVLRFRILISA